LKTKGYACDLRQAYDNVMKGKYEVIKLVHGVQVGYHYEPTDLATAVKDFNEIDNFNTDSFIIYQVVKTNEADL